MFKATLLLCVFSLTSYIFAQERPTRVSVHASKVFVPGGFDDNDQVEVMIEMEFPNVCYRMEKTEVIRSGDVNTITIKTYALRYQGDGTVCAEVLTPYLNVVKIGLLKQGLHEVVINPGPKEIRKTLGVKAAVSNLPDEHLYAPVEFADIVEDRLDKKKYIHLQGSYPVYKHGCARIVEIKQIRDADNLLTVLPIMEMFFDDRCAAEDLQFKRRVPMEHSFEGESLLHVRKFNGGSFDKLVKN